MLLGFEKDLVSLKNNQPQHNLMKQLIALMLLQVVCFSSIHAQFSQDDIKEGLEELYEGKAISPLYSIGDLWLMRNYIFAEKGYAFNNARLSSFYNQHFGFNGTSKNVNAKLTPKDKEVIAQIQARENRLKAERKSCTIRMKTFLLRDGKMTYPKGVSGPELDDLSYKYLSCKPISEHLFILNVASDFHIETVSCCGGEGAITKNLRVFVYDSRTQKLKEIPQRIVQDFEVASIQKEKYLFMRSLPFSSAAFHPNAPTVRIYELENFKLLGEVSQVFFEGMREIKDPKDAIMEIWHVHEVLAYPHLKKGLYIFVNGKLIKTTLNEKLEAPMYFAG